MSACKFSEVGCDISIDNHEEKRPIKHLSLLNDEMRSMQRNFEKLAETESAYLTEFQSSKTLVNGIAARETPQLIWKISNWRDKVRLARLRLEPWQLSPPFYSHPLGYQMIAMVAPYGFSEGFGNSLAVYVQIIQGDYDGVLKWPFSKSVVMTLYDQRKELLKRRNYQYEMTAQMLPKDEIFTRRPKKSTPNQPFGCLKFCPLNALMDSSYVDNDEALIGISIF